MSSNGCSVAALTSDPIPLKALQIFEGKYKYLVNPPDPEQFYPSTDFQTILDAARTGHAVFRTPPLLMRRLRLEACREQHFFGQHRKTCPISGYLSQFGPRIDPMTSAAEK